MRKIKTYLRMIWEHFRGKLLKMNLRRNLSYNGEVEYLILQINNKCNCKCKWCGPKCYNPDIPSMEMPANILYSFLKPLYKNLKYLALSGGEPLIAQETDRYVNFIAKEYPNILLHLETNGILFNQKWQELFSSNLYKVHISLNASNVETYRKGVFEDGGRYIEAKKILLII
jgi:molybdenum cofactor biosynthesis enzyme MoaA